MKEKVGGDRVENQELGPESLQYTNEGQKVAAALMHFKMGTSAGDWASNRLATALGATPVMYGTWADFKTKFKEQFIPPQT